MLCTKCHKREAIYSPSYMEGSFCNICFMSFFKNQIKKSLKEQNFFRYAHEILNTHSKKFNHLKKYKSNIKNLSLILFDYDDLNTFILKRLFKSFLSKQSINSNIVKSINVMNESRDKLNQILNFSSINKQYNMENNASQIKTYIILPFSAEEISFILLNQWFTNHFIKSDNIIFPFKKSLDKEIKLYGKLKGIDKLHKPISFVSKLKKFNINITQEKFDLVKKLFKNYPDTVFSTISFHKFL